MTRKRRRRNEFLIVCLLTFLSSNTFCSPSNSIDVIVVSNATYETPYNDVINKTLESVYVFPESNNTWMERAKLTVESNATHDFPLIIVVRQKQGILSWQIPYEVASQSTAGLNILNYTTTSRTLCSSNFYNSSGSDNDTDEFVTVSISTASHSNVSVHLVMSLVKAFNLRPEEVEQVTISPSEPTYYAYAFPKNNDASVVVQVTSASFVCMTMSIQNATCPVFDLERTIQYSGYWQTVSKQGALTISKEMFPNGFFVVLVVKGDDSDCEGAKQAPQQARDRTKNVSVVIKTSITAKEYIVSFAIVSVSIFCFCFMYVMVAFVAKIRQLRRRRNLGAIAYIDDSHENSSIVQAASPSPINAEVARELYTNSGECRISGSVSSEDSSLDEDSIDMMQDAYSNKEIVRTKLVLSVCDLARKEPKILRHKSRLYLYYLITVAVFYTLPVMQLVTTYQNVLHVTGNQDLCYYNFLCAHPWSVWSDFNHVFSNFGYIFLGSLFLFITYMREKDDVESMKSCFGIPQHYGLFYAMGVALIMEGILSGCYHFCPNHTNFQFDTSFMYIISVLCMVKIYQTRHPDINARASVTFGVLALTIFLGLIGVLDGSTLYWISFTIIHLTVCLFLSAQIYYMGRWKLDGGVFRRVFMTMKHDARSGIRYLFRPIYWKRLLLLVIGNLCNIAIAVYGNLHHDKDFAIYLLAVLMSNLMLYLFFYIVMKLCHKERLLTQPSIYLILSFIAWGASMYFFVNKTISWATTPAKSRVYNKPCVLFGFFDTHDIWHLISAFAMFFSFMVLLTLDDDLVDVHRSQIPVF